MPTLSRRHDGPSSSYDYYSDDDDDDGPAYVTSPKPLVEYIECDQDLSPNTVLDPRSSVDTYASDASEQDDLGLLQPERDLVADSIPPLPSYCHEITEPYARPSTPKQFAELFPSMDRLSVRHDDFTEDGNMNLRVDTVLPGPRRTAVQLFHLRMYDLARRDFSLRRYCRDSGRQVCSSKRHYAAPAPLSRPSLQRSVSSAIKTLAPNKPQVQRAHSSSSTFASSAGRDGKRPPTSQSFDDTASSTSSSRASVADHPKSSSSSSRPVPTNAIKLEFGNYARVNVERKGSSKGKSNKRYEFEWWGHRYAWKRVVEKHLDGVVSFHLLRDAEPTPVAHIVPETRSPNQVEADERAGGWIPPCYMWINDKAIIDAVTDVAE